MNAQNSYFLLNSMNKRVPKSIFSVLFVIALLVGAYFAGQEILENDHLREFVNGFGYIGVFAMAIIGGFNIIVPVPAITFLPIFLAADLNFLGIIITIALGATLADSIAYLLGNASRAVLNDSKQERLAALLREVQEKRAWLIPILLILYGSFVPLPNEVIVAPLAFIGYKFRYILPLVLIGNFVFNYLAATGINSLI